MQRLEKIISKLSFEHRRGFYHFLQIPPPRKKRISKERQNMVKLWEYLDHEHGSKNKRRPDQMIEDLVQNHQLRSKMVKFLCTYLIQQKSTEDHHHRPVLLAQTANELELDFIWETALKESQIAINSLPNHRDHLMVYQIEILNHKKLDYRHNRKQEIDYNHKAEALSRFTLLEMLKLVTNQHAHSVSIPASNPLPAYINFTIANVAPHFVHTDRLVYLYYELYLLQNESRRITGFPLWLEKLIECHQNLYPEDLLELSTLAQNYLVEKVNLGPENPALLQQLFRFYQIAMEHQFPQFEKEMTSAEYKNIITVAAKLNEIAWGEKFMEDKLELLPEKIRHDARLFGHAILYYHQGQYARALTGLEELMQDHKNFGSRGNLDDPFFKMDARTLNLRILFRRKDIDQLESSLEAFLRWLKRNEAIARPRRERHRDVLKACRRLIHVGVNTGWEQKRDKIIRDCESKGIDLANPTLRACLESMPY